MSRPANVAVLGATGSIGRSTLDVIGRHPDRFRAFALTANTQSEELFELCTLHRPRVAVLADPQGAEALRRRLAGADVATEVLAGEAGLVSAATRPEVDVVMAAIVGAAGLAPTLAAARAGKKLLLANKEALVMAGPIFMGAVRAQGAELLPIDSEHNAVFQCLPPATQADARMLDAGGVRRILLTASGGPFRRATLEQMRAATPEQACAHPNWEMGRKISVDSATMMNKGLELIEAHLLFGVPPERIEIVVHPQSVIHSLVEYLDGSMLAQLGNPDMRTPIAHALAYPERIASGVAPLDLAAIARLDFEAPDTQRFPCLALARDALASGGGPCVLNAANEIAVDAFLQRRIAFTEIARVVARVLDTLGATPAPVDLGAVLALDARARALARECLSRTVA